MERIYKMSESEKELLNIIGRHPELSPKELLQYTKYRWVGTVMRKLQRFKELCILHGPLYDPNYSKLCKNSLHKLHFIIETKKSLEIVIPYLKLIGSIRLIYPVLSHKKVLIAVYYSSNDTETEALFQLLKSSGIIADYDVRVWGSKRMIENPNFFGDIDPSLDNLLDPCDIPDMSLEQHDTDWNECDIRIIPYLQYGGFKLIEILREEKKLHRSWTYEQIRYSREKMLKHGLIKKTYGILPFLQDQNTVFELFFEPEDINETSKILYNFARGARVYKEYLLCDNGGWLLCECHPSFLKNLMHKLDQIDEIKEKEVYPVRSNPPQRYGFGKPIELKYFDFDNQTLEYPYRVYRERIKERLESE